MAAKPTLEELLKSIDPRRLSQSCKDHHLSEVALHITEWRSIAPFFRLREEDEEQIVTKFHKDLQAQKIAMLRKWREKRGYKATYKELVKVFWKVNKLSLVEEVCKVLTSESSCSESEGEADQVCAEGSHYQKWTLPKYARYLKGRYCTTRPPVLNLQWPPSPTHTVFNLALIQKHRLEGPNEELVRLLQRGQVKEAAESHTEIKLSNLMRADDEERKIILIEGAPGSGKSTLAWHICQKWEKGQMLSEYKVVVFVQLRDLKVQSAQCIADILPIPRQDMGNEIASLLTGDNRWGKEVLLVLDGWDELQPDCPAHSLCLQLIQIPEYLNMHLSSLIITSRPVSSGELQCHASSRVEVLGFKPEEVQQYFKACFGDDHQLYKKFVTQLRKLRVVEASCFLPLNAAIVVYIFLTCNCSLPQTLHDVFEKMVISSVVRHITGRGEAKGEITASSLRDLPPDIEVPLSAVSSLAFHGIWINKVVFSERDVKIFKLLDVNSTLSLVQVVESFGMCGRSKSYNFFHLQIQELLAAYHISKLEENEQVKIFRDLFGKPHFATVFQFYAAFTKLQAKGIREVLVDMIRSKRYETILQCVYESQDMSLCQFVGFVLGTIPETKSTVTEKPLCLLTLRSSPLYIIALGYFLCCYCYYCTEELTITVYEVDTVRIRLLLREFQYHQSRIAATPPQHHSYGSLGFRFALVVRSDLNNFVHCASELLGSLEPYTTRIVFDIQDEVVFQRLSRYLCRLAEHASFLQHFELLQCCGVSTLTIDDPFLSFVQATPNIHSIKVARVELKFSVESLKAICSNLATNHTIKYLTFTDCQLVLKDPIEPQLFAIDFSSSLRVIDLQSTTLCGLTLPLLMGLSNNTSVVELVLNACEVDLTAENGHALCNMLKTNTALRSLTIGGFGDSEYGVFRYPQHVDLSSICEGLTSNASLTYLEIYMCEVVVTGERWPTLSHMLQTNTTLKSLKLHNNHGISNEGTVFLSLGLAQNRGLETLSIEGCEISTAVVELAEALKANCCLSSLHISYNDVGEHFINIVMSLKVNFTIRDLKASLCGISVKVIEQLHTTRTLEALDLSANLIGNEGAIRIAQLVTSSCSLLQLNIRDCGIGDNGVEYIATALEEHNSLEILHMPNNPFMDRGLLALGRSLKRNKSLRTLSCYHHNFMTHFGGGIRTTVDGEKQFVLSLCENDHLTDLYLSYANKVRDEVNKVNQSRQEKKCHTLVAHEYEEHYYG